MSEGSRAELTINGKRFVLGCAPGQEARLEELGARFDARVKELVEALGDIGAERLFLAAGISLLDEIDAMGQGAPVAGAGMEDRIRMLERRAATVLVEAAARIEALSSRVDPES